MVMSTPSASAPNVAAAVRTSAATASTPAPVRFGGGDAVSRILGEPVTVTLSAEGAKITASLSRGGGAPDTQYKPQIAPNAAALYGVGTSMLSGLKDQPLLKMLRAVDDLADSLATPLSGFGVDAAQARSLVSLTRAMLKLRVLTGGGGNDGMVVRQGNLFVQFDKLDLKV